MDNPLGNLGGMMKQVKKIYEGVQKAQEELAQMRVEATSGGGTVKAVVSGKGQLVELKIDPQAVDPEDVEMLEDLVVSAIRKAQEDAEKVEVEHLQAATGGLPLAGLL